MRILAATALAILIWLVGLFVFADRVRGYAPAAEPGRADAIVALTGPSAERVNAAVRLLEQGKGERLLVSGVHPDVKKAELQAVSPGSVDLFACCVDLGFQAENTSGNAHEIAEWARGRSYGDLIVVTSDYHMPRALAEIRGAAPGLRLTPYAVETPALDDRDWWRSSHTARRMALEYMKYIVVLARETVRGLTGRMRSGQAPSARQESDAA